MCVDVWLVCVCNLARLRVRACTLLQCEISQRVSAACMCARVQNAFKCGLWSHTCLNTLISVWFHHRSLPSDHVLSWTVAFSAPPAHFTRRCAFKRLWKHGALRPQKPLRLIRDGEAGRSGIFISNTYSLRCHHQNDSALRWAAV